MKLKSPLGLMIGLALLGIGLAAGGVFYKTFIHEPLPGGHSNGAGERLGGLPSFGKLRPNGTPTALAALGRLTPRGNVIEIGGLLGDRLEKLVVEEGNWVKQGTILGYLESHLERKAERDAIAAQLAEAKARLAAELTFLDAQIKEAEVGVEQAGKLDPLDVAAHKAKTQLLESELATAQTDLDRLQSLTTPGAVSPQKLAQQVQVVSRFRHELAAAKAMLAKASAGQGLNRKRAEVVLETARAGRKKAETGAQLDSLAKNLALADVRLERTVLRAPRDGEILKVLSRPGERVDQKPILKMGDTRTMVAIAEVYETDVLLVQSGQRARVTSPALPQALTGTVDKVGRIIYKNDVHTIDPAASADARVVEVAIRLDPSETASRMTNLQVDVLIELGDSQ